MAVIWTVETASTRSIGAPSGEPIRSGDRLVGVAGGVPGLQPSEQLAIQGRGEEPLSLWIASDAGVRRVEVHPGTLPEKNPPLVGIAPPRNHVIDVRDTPVVAALGIRKDDRLLRVQGVRIRQLGDLRRALTEHPGPLAVEVLRGGEELLLAGPALSRQDALALADMLAVGQDLESTEIVVQPGQPADLAGLRTGDRVRRIDGTEVSSWAELRLLVQQASQAGRSARFDVARSDEPGGVPVFRTILAAPEARPILDYGLSVRRREYVYRADSFAQAIVFGASASWKFLQDSWITVKRMVLQDVSPKNLGGIITIGAVSYSFAEDPVKLFFFLCLLSINLAFLNVLPIPVLDGGHLFFLIVEKIKGSPVSERVLGYSQMIGVVLILSLMVYVTYNDLVRWVFRS